MTETVEKFHFETGMYRPPSEGGSHSLLIRITRNCPWNRCTFCSMYKGEKFEVRSPGAVIKDIDAIAEICRRLRDPDRNRGSGGGIHRKAVAELVGRFPELGYHHGFEMVINWLQSGGRTVFLQDANSLLMKTGQLVEVLAYLRRTFPSIDRVTSYARSRTLAMKSSESLVSIRKAGLDRLHVGLETGDDDLLKKINKGVTAKGHIEGGKKAMAAGFQLSEYWMPGLGGKAMWESHAVNTARVLSEIDPHYIRSRPIFPAHGTPLYEQQQTGEFQLLSPHEHLLELNLMIENLHVTGNVCFDHAGNYWRDRNGRVLFSRSYEGYRFPDQKPEVLDRIAEGLKVKNRRPGFFRL